MASLSAWYVNTGSNVSWISAISLTICEGLFILNPAYTIIKFVRTCLQDFWTNFVDYKII